MKPKKKHHFRKNESDEVQLKRKKKVPRDKYRNHQLWLEEDLEEEEEELSIEKDASIIYLSPNWGFA